MDKSKKLLIGFSVLIFTVLFTFFSPQNVFAQEEPCSKPKVAVIMELYEENEGEFTKHLNEQFPSQPRGSWFYEIQEKVLEELRMNSPGTQFVQATGGIPNDCDYYFKYILALIGAGEDIEIYNHLLSSEYTAYFMISQLAQNSACVGKNYVLSVKSTKDDRDIYKTIERNIAAHGNIGNRIKKQEESYRVPPRGPEIKVSQNREYVSPLEEERKLQLKIDVINCKGEQIFDKNFGQTVTLTKETKRGELECDSHDVYYKSDNKLEIIIQKPTGTSALFALKKGINPEEVTIKLVTCGIDKEAHKETKIQIHGLELKVKPEKKEIFPGEETKITVKLSEVDVNGAKKPVAEKRIQIKVKGIVNGHIYPSGYVTTNQNGKAVLTYEAGDKDKKVVVKAKFQPKDYPEFVEDKGIVAVANSHVFARITLKEETTTKSDGTIKSYYGSTTPEKKIVKGNSYEIISVTILVNFEEKPEVLYGDFEMGKPLDQQKVIGYNYKITDFKVISATYSDEGTYYEADYDNAGRLIIESTSKTTRSGTQKKIELQSGGGNTMSIDVDKTTGKINHIDLPFFEVVFTVDENYNDTGKKGMAYGREPINISDTKSYDSKLQVSPPLDSCENVTGGDGVHYVSGKCVEENRKVDSFCKQTTTEKTTYQWEVRR